jgi:hypothetical protein
MPEPSVSSIAIYQLRVVLCGVSPLVWRRLLVVSTTSIAELHEILQNAFGWSGEHLHRFLKTSPVLLGFRRGRPTTISKARKTWRSKPLNAIARQVCVNHSATRIVHLSKGLKNISHFSPKTLPILGTAKVVCLETWRMKWQIIALSSGNDLSPALQLGRLQLHRLFGKGK